MKKIILVRHGKSSWEHDVNDKERPLKQRGINDARLVVESFQNHHIKLDKIFSSPAKRASSTCNIFMNYLQIPPEKLNIEEELYDFSGQNVINFIKKLDDSYNTIMIFGHNNAFTSIANIFGDKFIDNLPTSGLVFISFEVNTWRAIVEGKTELTIFPRDLKHS
jgi:phosphohistidine phosphatase